MRKIILFLFALLAFSCTHKEEVETEPPPPPPVEEEVVEEAPDISEDLIAVFNKLIISIKKHDIDSILSCYSDTALYGYEDSLQGKFSCFNEEATIRGQDMLDQQYRHMIRRKILDNIEFEIKKIDQEKLSIGFINAWAVNDYSIAETLVFVKNGTGYKIQEHIIHKY